MSQSELNAAIEAYEDGALDRDGMIRLFQNLVDSGDAWRLNGHYGRMAMELIGLGLVASKLH